MEEAKEKVETIDEKVDKFFDEEEGKTPGETSDSEKPEGEETETEETAGAEPEKTEKVKEVEADESLSVEEKLEKIKEILNSDEAIEAYIKEKGYHKDPAWQKLREKLKQAEESVSKSGLSEEDKKLIDDVKQLTSSREYIELSMKRNGYTQEAIDKSLREKGFDVQEKAGDDVQLVISKLGLDPKAVDENTRATIGDITKVVDILFQDRIGKILPKTIKPLQDNIMERERKEAGYKLFDSMEKLVKSEEILDFKKDIEPMLDKFLKENPNATQEDIYEHFKELNHKLTIERLKTKGKKVERDEKKMNLRSNKDTTHIEPGKLPKKTGNLDKDIDSALDSLGIT